VYSIDIEGEFLPYKWKDLTVGEILPYKWMVLTVGESLPYKWEILTDWATI